MQVYCSQGFVKGLGRVSYKRVRFPFLGIPVSSPIQFPLPKLKLAKPLMAIRNVGEDEVIVAKAEMATQA